MQLTDAELEVIYDIIYDYAYYGPDEIVYGNGAEAVSLRTGLAKVEDERKARGL